ncbi:fibronectin type III domain-containing protein [Flammeovirga sp. OC4]|uniref:fibronectin type III domain-containing protein n=1 Tax=Flammeovirga sp. OC4 TaxID=1382345 RepID=UPI0005C68D1A|nr:fibronectin type III domain-containing protein [Flammeovirga sp. OC4]
MKKKVITSEGMNILDVVLFLEGSVEGLPAFLERNPHINPNGIINAGTEVIIDTDNQERPEIVNYFQSRGVRVNTGDIEIPSPPSGLSAVPTSSEIGSITLNWYDNSQGLYAFEIWRRKKGALDFLRIYDTSVGETTWQNDNLDHGTTYEYQVRVKGFAGAVEFSNIAEATTPDSDLQIFNTNSSKLVATGTNFVWDHRAGISYLFALSGKDKINSISACEAGVSGVIDLTSNDWLNLVYICFKNALNPDLRLGSWVNQTGVVLDVENAFYEPSDFERMLTELERVNDPDNVISDRTFNAGIVLVDLDDNPTLQTRIDALTALGWTIKIVNYKLLSATIGERTYISFDNRVTANSGAELWFVNGKRVVGGVQLEQGDLVELYHSNVGGISLIDLSHISLVDFLTNDIILDKDIEINMKFTKMSTYFLINFFQYLYDLNTLNLVFDFCDSEIDINSELIFLSFEIFKKHNTNVYTPIFEEISTGGNTRSQLFAMYDINDNVVNTRSYGMTETNEWKSFVANSDRAFVGSHTILRYCANIDLNNLIKIDRQSWGGATSYYHYNTFMSSVTFSNLTVFSDVKLEGSFIDSLNDSELTDVFNSYFSSVPNVEQITNRKNCNVLRLLHSGSVREGDGFVADMSNSKIKGFGDERGYFSNLKIRNGTYIFPDSLENMTLLGRQNGGVYNFSACSRLLRINTTHQIYGAYFNSHATVILPANSTLEHVEIQGFWKYTNQVTFANLQTQNKLKSLVSLCENFKTETIDFSNHTLLEKIQCNISSIVNLSSAPNVKDVIFRCEDIDNFSHTEMISSAWLNLESIQLSNFWNSSNFDTLNDILDDLLLYSSGVNRSFVLVNISNQPQSTTEKILELESKGWTYSRSLGQE